MGLSRFLQNFNKKACKLVLTWLISRYAPGAVLTVLFMMLYKVVSTFDFVDEILKYDSSNERC